MNDLIRRQAAIEYLMTNMNWYDEDGYEVVGLEELSSRSERLNEVKEGALATNKNR